MKVQWLVVGAGFTGSTIAERLASEGDQRVLVIDRRNHIGGNAFDEYDESGLLVHRYGPHIFHTNSERVWKYLQRFSDWRPYQHRVRGLVQGALVPVPFNLTSLGMLYPKCLADNLATRLVDSYGLGTRVPIMKLRENPEFRELASFVYANIFEGYTKKQWGVPLEALDGSVGARVPVVIGNDDRYFQDSYQAMPSPGYSALFRRMLGHRNIWLMLNTDLRDIIGQVAFDHLVYTGPIDELCSFVHGHLPYRSVRFHFAFVHREWQQDVATINYPNEYEFTRITEQKRLTGQTHPGTTLVTEYPMPHVPGVTEPYYPVPAEANRELYDRYVTEAKTAFGSQLTLAGRLADYRYYNMDQAVARGLRVFQDLKESGEPRRY